MDQLLEGQPAACLRRSREVLGPGGVSEREQELAVLVVRVGEDTLRDVVAVNGRRNAADPEVPHDRQRRIDSLRVRGYQGNRRGSGGQVPGVRPRIGELTKCRAVLDRDERPALGVLGAPGSSARIEDPFEVLRIERPFEEAADCWSELVEIRGCPPLVEREATAALAIHSEHRRRDLTAAKAFALRTLEIEPGPVWEAAARHRLARLDRNMTLQKSEARSLKFEA